jgi:hypothetical protein
MDFSGLLTYIGLLVAAYAVLPEHHRISLGVFINLPIKFLGGFVFLSASFLIYLSLGDTYFSTKWEFLDNDYLQNFYVTSAYTILILYTFLIIYRVKQGKLSRFNILRFKKFLEDLYLLKEFRVLSDTLTPNLDRLVQLASKDLFLQRVARYLLKVTRPETLTNAELWYRKGVPRINIVFLGREDEPMVEVEKISFYKRVKFLITDSIPKLIYFRFYDVVNYLFLSGQTSEIAKQILERIVYQRDYMDHFVLYRPHFALVLFNMPSDIRDLSSNNILYSFIKNTESIFYKEIKEMAAYGRSEKTPILNSILSDCHKAEEREVYRPVGEYVIHYLSEQGKKPIDELDYEYDSNFEEFGRSQNPIYAGIAFFDDMVKSAIDQGVKWHMWLYYTRYWVKAICDNTKAGAWEDQTEFPNRYSRILYEILSIQKGWILSNLGNGKIQLDNLNEDDNGNIFKSTCTSYVQCMKAISDCSKIPDRKKIYYIEDIWDLYLRLKKSENVHEQNLGDYLMHSIKRELNMYSTSPNKQRAFYSILHSTLTGLDRIKYPFDLYTQGVTSLESIGAELRIV